MRNLTKERQMVADTIASVKFDEVEQAADIVGSVVDRYSNSPSIMAGLSFLAGVAVGKSESGNSTNEKNMGDPENDEKLKRLHYLYASDIIDNVELPARRLHDAMCCTIARFHDIQAQDGRELNGEDATELHELLECFAHTLKAVQESALSVARRADNAALGVAD